MIIIFYTKEFLSKETDILAWEIFSTLLRQSLQYSFFLSSKDDKNFTLPLKIVTY